MLGLFRFISEADHPEATSPKENYTTTVKGYNPKMDEYFNEYIQKKKSETKIHKSSYGNPQSTSEMIPSKTEFLDMLGISDEETDDSGCQCPSVQEDTSSHDSSFHEDSLLADTPTKEQIHLNHTNSEIYDSGQTQLHPEDHIEEATDSCQTDSEGECEELEQESQSCDHENSIESESEHECYNQHNQTIESDCDKNHEGENSEAGSDEEDSVKPYNLFDQDTVSYNGSDESDNEDDSETENDPRQNPSNMIRRGMVTGCYPPQTITYSRQMGVSNHQATSGITTYHVDHFNSYDDEAEIYNMMNYCSTAPSINLKGYAFPRVSPDDIVDVTEFWEYDFQVDRNIIPKMGSWEKLGIEPKRDENFQDFQKFITYKNLYIKWVHCNESKEQWYRKYGWSSLRNVLFVKPRSCKIYPGECKAIKGLVEKLRRFHVDYGCQNVFSK